MPSSVPEPHTSFTPKATDVTSILSSSGPPGGLIQEEQAAENADAILASKKDLGNVYLFPEDVEVDQPEYGPEIKQQLKTGKERAGERLTSS